MNKHNCQHLRAWAVAVVTMMAATLPAQVEVEYFIDTDPGVGLATKAATPADADGNISFAPSTQDLSPGLHVLGWRAFKQSGGKRYFAPTLMQEFFIPREDNPALVTRAEYFWDEDPGHGRGTPIALSTGAEVNLTDIELSTADLATGSHLLGIRVCGNEGWGPTLRQEIYVPRSMENAKVTYAEYFFDSDPGIGQAMPIAIAAGKEVEMENLEVSTAKLAPGVHKIGIRAYGDSGWGPTSIAEFNVTVTEAELSLLSAEYFVDTDPGFGHGTPINITTQHEVTFDGLGLSLNDLSQGAHLLGVRYRGTNGWSPTYTTKFFHSEGDGNSVAAAEYFFDTDPGFGHGTPISIAAGQEVSVDGLGLPVNDLSAGAHLLGVRYRGTNGWSATYTTQFAVTTGDGVSIASAEYFWNEDPGFGKGKPLALTPGEEVTLEDVGIPTYDVIGDAVLYIRYRGPQGWSPTISFSIITEAEGSYTLDAATATNASTRNYQTLADAVTDFADRGVGSDITLNVVTSNTTYNLDATGEQALAQFAALGESLDRVGSPREEKTIAFTAEESGNTLAITTTAEGLPTVVGALAHSRTENVTLTINGTAYDFAPASSRHDEVCSGNATTARALSQISPAVTATWAAQPHKDTTISGYLIDGEGDLQAMTLTNSGTRTDSLAYNVTLLDESSNVLASYVYYVYVRPLVGNSTFSKLSPADKTVVYPGEQTIQWNTQAEVAGGYRLSISRVPLSDETAEPEVTNIDTDQKSYTLAVEEGYLYTWTVTAYGFCDELTSAARTIYGRTLEIDAADLAALRQLYTDFDGASWNGTQWNTASSRITSNNSNWSGVTFNAYGRVTGINLSRRGLVGNTLNADILAPMTALTTLNLSYNQIDELTGVLPATITSLDLSYQHRAYNNNTTWPGLENLASQTVTMGQNGSIVLTPVIGYDHSARNFDAHPTLSVYTPEYSQLGTLTWSAANASYAFSAGNRQLTTEQDADVVLVAGGSLAGKLSAMPATLHFVRGDANLTGLVDVNDVQRTLNYVLNSSNNSTFGLWSANTYTKYETKPVINIQDIVCTVDIVLDETSAPSPLRRAKDASSQDEEIQSLFYPENHSIWLATNDEVAAFDLELEGVSAAQVRLMLSGRDWQMTARNTVRGVRLVVFSPTGAVLPTGTTELLRLSKDGRPVSVQASSPEAESLAAGVDDSSTTQILTPPAGEPETIYDLGGRRIAQPRQKGVYIINGKKQIK